MDRPSRATKDIDGLVRGDLGEFMQTLEEVLAEPWGPLTLRHGPVTVIDVPTRVQKPRRFDIYIELRGVTWRRIQFEIAPDEAGIGDESESTEPAPLGAFGLPDPDSLVSITLRYQIAQELRAVSDPHDPPNTVNDRARDVVDLLLIRNLTTVMGLPTNTEIATAARAVFRSRAEEAIRLGLTPRQWPAVIISYPHWETDYERAAESAGVELPLDDAVAQVNAWIVELQRV